MCGAPSKSEIRVRRLAQVEKAVHKAEMMCYKQTVKFRKIVLISYPVSLIELTFGITHLK